MNSPPMMRYLSGWLVLSLALCSCGTLGIGKKQAVKEPSPFGTSGIPPQLRARGNADPGTPVVPGGNTPTASSIPANITPEEEIVFTDPDNPEASLPELSVILTAPKRRGPWEESETIARQRAAREGKPMLIWFTDSARSPMCKAIAQELFNNPDFEKWASEKIIRLRVDSNVRAHESVKDQNLSIDEANTREIDLANHVARMKKTYKVLGQPSLYMLNPSGEVIGRYRGYKRGDADYTWGLFKQAEAVSANAYKEWRSGLEKKGYREWSDRKDRKVFARLTSYSHGTLILIEPDGTRCRTQENKLSDADKAWLAEQKKLRGIQ
jgi:thioredoxin-related protein